MVDRIGQGEDVQIFSGFDFDEEQTKQIEERHNDLIELEKSLLELNEIFNEMAVMVESQERVISQTHRSRTESFTDVRRQVSLENSDDSNKGQTLDRIEDNVGDAQEYVEKGKQQLAKAEEHKKSSNKVWALSNLSDQGSTDKSWSVM